MEIKSDIEQNIIERIIALPASDKKKITRILKIIKRLKEEGETETSMKVITSVAELEKVFGKE